MLGRDRLVEQGHPGTASPASSMSSQANDLMGHATQCVRKFAPNGRMRMRRTDNGHVTACKISDANPNEMIVSWSGDHIYSFDLVKSPDASEIRLGDAGGSINGHSRGKVTESRDRKRKWKKGASSSADGARRSFKPRRSRSRMGGDGDLALRVRYENGQSEDIAMDDASTSMSRSAAEEARESMLESSQRRSLQIAKSLIKLRKLIFSPGASNHASVGPAPLNPSDHVESFDSALGIAATCLPEMDDIMRSWGYPINPHEEDVIFQQTLRANRDSSRRFVQAAGTLARLLGGTLDTANPHAALKLFQQISYAPIQGSYHSARHGFCLELLKAIVLWLGGGLETLLQGFKRPANQRRGDPRFPVPDEAKQSGIDEYLIPYLLRLAREGSIPNIDASRFERDEYRKTFESESAAVIAFSNAIKIPLDDLSTATMSLSSPGDGIMPITQDRNAALRFWGFEVGRGVLMNAGEGINFQFVNTAFGGLGTAHTVGEDRLQEDIDPESDGSIDIDDAGSDAELVLLDDLHDEIADHMAEHDAQDDDTANEDDSDHDSGEDEDEDITAEERQFMFQSASNRGKLRESVEKNVQCSSHTRQYRGHCNFKTVKDVNFFGLNDEYVVSGSDSGHLFIWDKKSSELINILEGDGEVVNVVQGMSMISFKYKINITQTMVTQTTDCLAS